MRAHLDALLGREVLTNHIRIAGMAAEPLFERNLQALQRFLARRGWTGAYDQIRVRLDHIREVAGERRIVFRTAKRKRVVNIPVTERPGAMIDATPKEQDDLLVGARGRPWTSGSTLSGAMTKLKRDLELRRELHHYDARAYCVTRLVRAGLTLDKLALHMGWSPSYAAKMLDTYAALMGAPPAEVVRGIGKEVQNDCKTPRSSNVSHSARA